VANIPCFFFERYNDGKMGNPASGSRGGKHVSDGITKAAITVRDKLGNSSNKRTSVSTHSDDCESGDVLLYAHLQEAVDLFDFKSEGNLYIEIDTGKSRAVLKVAARKYKRQKIDARAAYV